MAEVVVACTNYGAKGRKLLEALRGKALKLIFA